MHTLADTNPENSLATSSEGTAARDLAAIDAQLANMEPITLAELNAQARMMTRVDRKYFVPRELFLDLLVATEDDFQVLEIAGRHRFEYRTVYFDTPDFRFFRDHVQGRRRRFKIRTRTYVDTGTSHLEVKSKGYRGQTVKQRIIHPVDHPTELTGAGQNFVDAILDPQGGVSARPRVSAADLAPVLETVYDRITLTHDQQRLTCDLDIETRNGGETHEGPRDVLVETKSADGVSIWDHLLKQAGIREHKVSKYCVGASLLNPELPANPWNRTIRRFFR
ncbi:polyphosphate polymerase domain-containing protein [Brevibacterium limosum]|uniref:polyphosphate polymerase domain-containing protein n=1 Tax=Brevibacterium limosum TaxID=2697565 RepID=UPI00142394DC|nr:polyphosphate polymerase domain-containing protein [Brevibacterium limosum]